MWNEVLNYDSMSDFGTEGEDLIEKLSLKETIIGGIKSVRIEYMNKNG
jgi:hypothetical protein